VTVDGLIGRERGPEVNVTKLSGRKADGTAEDDRGPIAMSWTFNEELAEARAALSALEAEETALANRLPSAKANLDAASAESRRQRTLARVEGGRKADAERAARDKDTAEAELELTEGKLELVRRDLAAQRERLPKLLRAAQGQSRAAFRAAAAAEVRAMLKLLREADAPNERLRAIASAADVAFPWSSPEAKDFGHRAGLPESIGLKALTYDPHAQDNSELGAWLRRMTEAGLLDAAERETVHVGPRAAYAAEVARRAARVDPQEAAIAARKAQLVASGEWDRMVRERSPRYRVVGTGSDTRTVQE
jgi:hypothetical protein